MASKTNNAVLDSANLRKNRVANPTGTGITQAYLDAHKPTYTQNSSAPQKAINAPVKASSSSSSSKEKASTASTIGNQAPYSFTKLKTGADYKPEQMFSSVGDVSYQNYDVGTPYSPTQMYQSVGDVSYNQLQTGDKLNFQQLNSGNPLQYQNYQNGKDLQLGNYNYTPQELLRLNQRGLDANSENIINEYQNMMNGGGGYTNYLDSARQNTLNATNQAYDDSARSYYQMYKSNQSKLPEQLSRLGVTGGGSETAQLGLMNNYSGNLYNNESQRAQQASNLNAQYDQMMADYNKGLAEQMASAYLNMAKGLQSENWGRESVNNQGVNEANRFNVNTQNEARRTNWDRWNTVSDNNTDLANRARESNWNRDYEVNRYNNQGINDTNRVNWDRANTVSDENARILNEAIYQNWQNRQNLANQNTGLLNEAGLTNWNRQNTVGDNNTELANQAVYQNWQNNQDVANRNTDLLNDAGLTNWNWGNTVRQYNNQGTNDTRQRNTDYNISERDTLRSREWETMDKEQAHEWEQAGIKDERMYNMAMYMLENGGNASMVKSMLGLTDKQAENLKKAWKKAQKSNKSSGSSKTSRRSYSSSSGGGTGDNFPDAPETKSTDAINPWVDPDPSKWTLKGDDATWGNNKSTGKVPDNAYTDTATGTARTHDEYLKKKNNNKTTLKGGGKMVQKTK